MQMKELVRILEDREAFVSEVFRWMDDGGWGVTVTESFLRELHDVYVGPVMLGYRSRVRELERGVEEALVTREVGVGLAKYLVELGMELSDVREKLRRYEDEADRELRDKFQEAAISMNEPSFVGKEKHGGMSGHEEGEEEEINPEYDRIITDAYVYALDLSDEEGMVTEAEVTMLDPTLTGNVEVFLRRPNSNFHWAIECDGSVYMLPEKIVLTPRKIAQIVFMIEESYKAHLSWERVVRMYFDNYYGDDKQGGG